jgi:hypothetical protein
MKIKLYPLSKERFFMDSPATINTAMRIIWEGEQDGNKWDDLFEYPYSVHDRTRILQRLEATAISLADLFAK